MNPHNKPAVWLALLLSFGLSLLFGFGTLFAARGGAIDLQGVFYFSRCLLQHHDPYKLADVTQTYRDALRNPPPEGVFDREKDYLPCVYQPTILPLLVPFVWLGWSLAWRVWAALLVAGFFASALLMEHTASRRAPGVALALTCLALAGAQLSIATGNPAAIATSLCAVAVWCFLENRFPWLGVLCMALSLLIKPHDSGLIWLYLVFAGSLYRRRALQALAIVMPCAVASVVWVSIAAPRWLPELKTNLAQHAAAGNPDFPGALTFTERVVTKTVLSLQSAVAVFTRDPRIYNTVACAVCGLLFLAIAAATLRRVRAAGALSPDELWLGLAALAPLALLAVYHRPYDARLLVLTIPGCALLARRGGLAGRVSVALTAIALLFTGDLTCALLLQAPEAFHANPATLSGRLVILLLTRAGVLALLATTLFHTAVYVRATLVPDDPRRTHPQAAL